MCSKVLLLLVGPRKLQDRSSQEEVEGTPVDVGRDAPVRVARALVAIAHGEDAETVLVWHALEMYEVKLLDVSDVVHVERCREGGGIGFGDAVRDHGDPEGPHCKVEGCWAGGRLKYRCGEWLEIP